MTHAATWFGSASDPYDRVSFGVMADEDSGVYPDWEADERMAIHHVTGSDNNDLFVDGFGPETLTLILYFDQREDFRAFRTRRHTTGTLQLLAGFTSIPGTEVTVSNRVYERIDGLFLQAPRRVVHRPDGTVECEATFLRLGGA